MTSSYTPSQIDLYESYIRLPPKYQRKNQPPLTLAYLTTLHIHQISHIPYENLQLHYSATHTVSLDPQTLFTKIVANARGRGGYCLEGSTFFNHVLRALGFQVYAAGVRIRRRSEEDGVPRGDYIGWFHMVNIVTLPTGQKYMVDVAFGGDGATRPLALVSGVAVPNLGSQQVRLVREAIPQLADRSQLQWVYQYRNGGEAGAWNAYYAFAEVEFLPQDWDIVNLFVSGRAGVGNFQTGNVLVVGFLRGEGEEEGEVTIVGKRMLVNGVLKENLGGKTRVVKVCRGEEERVRVLREVFGIQLVEEEIRGIRGRAVELKGEEDGNVMV